MWDSIYRTCKYFIYKNYRVLYITLCVMNIFFILPLKQYRIIPAIIQSTISIAQYIVSLIFTAFCFFNHPKFLFILYCYIDHNVLFYYKQYHSLTVIVLKTGLLPEIYYHLLANISFSTNR